MISADTIIGIDLDNTLACYDEVFYRAACAERLIEPALPQSKEKIRDAIRLLLQGESQWTRLQAIVYGPRMSDAIVFPGVANFLRRCAARHVTTFIVSHKTHFATLDGARVDLRHSALKWMKAKTFFDADGCALSPNHVFFESTREEKIARIRSLRCSYFIDDLTEVFAEISFPSETAKLLFAPHGTNSAAPDVRVFQTWRELGRFFFDDDRP